ncbi:D-glycero-alpha-D-manno-heptose-1,7-bisphosphate 7-phosphatase [Olivibacter sitiensis]|uniref:D-glycero-alpha-D-manno-heptose-1,7-bisphosphate 7-phosphatase n=1 Tax=Olivibacter sitiensis TaxID=376470 RepID=UPI00042A305F|nr:HAD family hydrolase [Olivibacter sitiensis]
MKKRALFLDRDGIINLDKGYVHRIADFDFVDGIFDLCTYFQERGYLLIVVTNQSGIARGYYTEKDFQILSGWMNEKFEEKNIHIAKVYYCPDHPDITGPSQRRKPNPGMLLEAAQEFDLDLSTSVMIGDKESDMLAAENAGVTLRLLLGKKPNIYREFLEKASEHKI